MSGSSTRRRQKKLEKNRKKRSALKQSIRKRELEFTGVNLMRKAREASFGPAFISAAIDDDAEQSLISIVVTRKVAGALVPHLILVDRACFGVKDATMFDMMSEGDLSEFVKSMEDGLGKLRRCEPEFAQSVVFHALEYARKLGFAPNKDFRIAMVEPRPEPLLETPLANRPRPLFINGPSDDVASVRARLAAAVGADGYDFIAAVPDELTVRSVMQALAERFGAEGEDELEDGDDEEVEEEGAPATIDTTGTPLENWTERR